MKSKHANRRSRTQPLTILTLTVLACVATPCSLGASALATVHAGKDQGLTADQAPANAITRKLLKHGKRASKVTGPPGQTASQPGNCGNVPGSTVQAQAPSTPPAQHKLKGAGSGGGPIIGLARLRLAKQKSAPRAQPGNTSASPSNAGPAHSDGCPPSTNGSTQHTSSNLPPHGGTAQSGGAGSQGNGSGSAGSQGSGRTGSQDSGGAPRSDPEANAESGHVPGGPEGSGSSSWPETPGGDTPPLLSLADAGGPFIPGPPYDDPLGGGSGNAADGGLPVGPDGFGQTLNLGDAPTDQPAGPGLLPITRGTTVPEPSTLGLLAIGLLGLLRSRKKTTR